MTTGYALVLLFFTQGSPPGVVGDLVAVFDTAEDCQAVREQIDRTERTRSSLVICVQFGDNGAVIVNGPG